jgi:endoglucanase
VKWLRANKMRGVIDGWTWWAGGPTWGSYLFTLDPVGGKNQPQMALLSPFLE